MPVLASNKLPSIEYPTIKKQLGAFKTYMEARTASFATDTSAEEFIALYFDCRRMRAALNAATAVVGIDQFAKDQEDNQLYEFTSEVTTLITAIDALTTEISSTYPREGGTGYLLDRTVPADADAPTWRVFTVAQIATAKTLVDAVIAEIT